MNAADGRGCVPLARGHDLGEQTGAPGDSDDLGAPAGQLDRDRRADPRGRAGYQRDLADEGPVGRVTHPLSIAWGRG